MAEEFEEQYLDVLQNIEFVLAQVYHAHKDMLDYDALNAVEGLIRIYQAETRGRAAPALRLNKIAQEALDSVEAICNFRLGRTNFEDKHKHRITMETSPLTVDEIIACLKRIRRSIQMWNKEGGQRGYFNFVSQFLP